MLGETARDTFEKSKDFWLPEESRLPDLLFEHSRAMGSPEHAERCAVAAALPANRLNGDSRYHGIGRRYYTDNRGSVYRGIGRPFL